MPVLPGHSSRAGSLPQKSNARHPAPHHSSGRALARQQLLILIHPPLREAEWRCSSGEWRAAPFDAVEHAACRLKRSQPEGSVPGWIPQRRDAESKRGAGRRGEPFWVLFAGPALRRLKKVPRRKGETASRHYRSNGYVRNQPKTRSAQRPPIHPHQLNPLSRPRINRRSGSCRVNSSARSYACRACSTRPNCRQNSARAEWAKW
ncbi:hypothetical protein ACVWYU_004472 [Pseudomonas sp. TE12234]